MYVNNIYLAFNKVVLLNFKFLPRHVEVKIKIKHYYLSVLQGRKVLIIKKEWSKSKK